MNDEIEILGLIQIELAKGHLYAALLTIEKAEDAKECRKRVDEFFEWIDKEAPGFS